MDTNFAFYSIMGSVGSGPWVKVLSPLSNTTNPDEALYVEETDTPPSGYLVGPHPRPKPHG